MIDAKLAGMYMQDNMNKLREEANVMSAKIEERENQQIVDADKKREEVKIMLKKLLDKHGIKLSI